jgi:hypothetical protein
MGGRVCPRKGETSSRNTYRARNNSERTAESSLLFSLVFVLADTLSLGQGEKKRDRGDARHYRPTFLSFGESGGRYPRPVFRGVSHPRCRHHGGTPKDRSGNDPEIIYSAGVRGEVPQKGAYALRIRSRNRTARINPDITREGSFFFSQLKMILFTK